MTTNRAMTRRVTVCVLCNGTGWHIVNLEWPKGNEPYMEPCPNGCDVPEVAP